MKKKKKTITSKATISPRTSPKASARQCKVEVVEIRNLGLKDASTYKPDPYVVIYFGTGEHRRTNTLYWTCNPLFRESFIFEDLSRDYDTTIRFEVWDRNRFLSDEMIGKCDVEVSSQKRGDMWIRLQSSSNQVDVGPWEPRNHSPGEIHIRWYVTAANSLFSAIDRTGEKGSGVDREALPVFNYSVLNTNIDRLMVYWKIFEGINDYVTKILAWTSPIESLAWFYIFHVAATYERLLQLFPAMGLLGMLRNLFILRRHGLAPSSTTANDPAPASTEEERPEGYLSALLHHARVAQRESEFMLEKLDRLHEVVHWLREEEAMGLTGVLLLLTLSGSFGSLMSSFLPTWVITTACVWCIFLVLPIYNKFPVLRRKYHWKNLLDEVQSMLQTTREAFGYACSNMHQGFMLKRRLYLYAKAYFTLRRVWKCVKHSREKYNFSDVATKNLHVTLKGTRNVAANFRNVTLEMVLQLQHPVTRLCPIVADSVPSWRCRLLFDIANHDAFPPQTSLPSPAPPLLLEFLAKDIKTESVLARAHIDVMSLPMNQESADIWQSLVSPVTGMTMAEVRVAYFAWGFGMMDEAILELKQLQSMTSYVGPTLPDDDPPRTYSANSLLQDNTSFAGSIVSPKFLSDSEFTGNESFYQPSAAALGASFYKPLAAGGLFRASGQGAYDPPKLSSPSPSNSALSRPRPPPPKFIPRGPPPRTQSAADS